MSTPVSFWGTPQIAASFLEILIPEFSVLYVVTQPDKPRSRRGNKTISSHVKQIANNYNIPTFTPSTLKENNSFFDSIKKYPVSLHIVFAYGKIIPDFIINSPFFNGVNFHASLLPQLRGASPIESALLKDLHETGWTLQKIAYQLDAGDIIQQEKISILKEDTQATLTEKLMQTLYSIGVSWIKNYMIDQYTPQQQDHKKATHSHKIEKNDGCLDWNSSSHKIINQYRAYVSWPSLFTYFNNKMVKLHFNLVHQPQKFDITKPIGSVSYMDDFLWVVCGDGFSLPIEFLQIEGKSKIKVKDFIHGYHIQPKQILFTNQVDSPNIS